MGDARAWKTTAAAFYPPNRPGRALTDPVTRGTAEGPLRAAADAWMDQSYAPPWEYGSYEVVEALTDGKGRPVQWAAVFEACGEHPKTAPSWWSEWTPADDEPAARPTDDEVGGS